MIVHYNFESSLNRVLATNTECHGKNTPLILNGQVLSKSLLNGFTGSVFEGILCLPAVLR